MKSLILIGILSFVVGTFGGIVPEPLATAKKTHLLGAKECTWGPSYWCKNLTTAAGCHAVKHCIQTVWEHQTLPPDHSSVCETCLEMVKEARDQLESNETQEEIKEVFEGSCRLIPIKPIAEGCVKLADEFIVDLVDTLASQMNPQVVCSVAGLCNNDRVLNLLHESTDVVTSPKRKTDSEANDRCSGCHTVIDLVEKKFRQANRDLVLQNFLQVCGRMGSLSDACSNIVVTYFNEIYRHLQENLNPTDFCLMAGECSAMFHTHANIQVTPLSNVGVLPVGEHDDLPCDLCKQLVQHLQDILIANTTEDEFHKVLTGICKQTKSFKDECINIVEEYYPMIYDFLANELNGTVICSMIGICQGGGLELVDSVPIVPLLPIESVHSAVLVESPAPPPVGRISLSKSGSSVKILPPNDLQLSPELAQLPIERIMPHTLTIVGDTKLCVFCEYFLHFVQEAITDPKTEEDIKQVIDSACDKLPSSVNETCRQFVDTYGSAFMAILAQDIDPSTVCPRLSLCPSQEAHNVEIFMRRNKGDKPNCPLCLFAITSLEELIKNKRTEENIRKGLSTLCSHLSNNLADECNDFVETYTDEIVEACIAQLNPQEVCVYLKLCEDKAPPRSLAPTKIEFGGRVATNEIPDRTINGLVVTRKEKDSGGCVLCEFVMSQLSKELKDKTTEDEIKQAVHGICNHLPKSISKECNSFVDQYADAVIQLLIEDMDPNEICKELKFCDSKTELQDFLETSLEVESPQCSLCRIVITQIEKMLQGKVTEAEIIRAVRNVCSVLPSERKKECNDFIDKYGERIIELLEQAVQPSEICSILLFCSEMNNVKLEIRKCSVCEAVIDVMNKILENPNVDHTLEHVLEKTCRALPFKYQNTCHEIIEKYGDKIFNKLTHAVDANLICSELRLCGSRVARPPRDTLVGSNKCTWGPGYWCLSESNANQCGAGAKQHCQEKVWLQGKPPK